MRSPVDREALVVGMTLVPGLYARNKLLRAPRSPRCAARGRARRCSAGIVRQLAGAHGEAEGLAVVRHGDVSRAPLPRPAGAASSGASS